LNAVAFCPSVIAEVTEYTVAARYHQFPSTAEADAAAAYRSHGAMAAATAAL